MGRFPAIVLSITSATFMAAGCGGGDDAVEVKFPDVSTLPKPVAPSSSKAAAKPTNASQGDPSQYSRVK